MQNLNLPNYDFKLTKSGNHVLIWDQIRKKNIVLTPEEWVRQNFMCFLSSEFGFPQSLMQVEGGLKYNKMNMRSDILCYNQAGNPILLVECKRPTLSITQKTFDQIARYNMSLKVPFLAVTNGLEHFYCQIDFDKKDFHFLPNLPQFEFVKEM